MESPSGRSGFRALIGRVTGDDVADLVLPQLLKPGGTNMGFLRLGVEDVSDVVTEHVALKDNTLEGGGKVVEQRCTEFTAMPGDPGELVCLVASQAPEVCSKGMVVATEEVDGESGRVPGDPLGVVEYREADQKARRVNAALACEGNEAAAALRAVVRRYHVNRRVEQPRYGREVHGRLYRATS